MAQLILKLSRKTSPALAIVRALFLSFLPVMAVANDAATAGVNSSTVAATENSDVCFPSSERPDDRLWYVSTRHLSCPASTTFSPSVGQYHHQQGWLDSDLETIVQSPAELTVIYVHGNRMSFGAALDRGWAVYHTIATADAPPIRFVIWSWPSDQIHGHPLRDVRVKAWRAEEEGVFLAQFLNRLPEDSKTSLIGYSYGARVLAGAMHILGGGTIEGSGIQHASDGATGHWLRAVLMAPAIDQDAFAPGHIFQNAVGVIEQPIILFNPCDPVLQRYDVIDRCRRNERAMGYAGVSNDGGMCAMEMNISGYIGRSHDERRYLRASPIMNTVRPYVWWQ